MERELERRVTTAGQEWTGAIVQRLVEPGGTDVLVGAVGDPDLGPVLALSSAVTGPVVAEGPRSACCR